MLYIKHNILTLISFNNTQFPYCYISDSNDEKKRIITYKINKCNVFTDTVISSQFDYDIQNKHVLLKTKADKNDLKIKFDETKIKIISDPQTISEKDIIIILKRTLGVENFNRFKNLLSLFLVL